MAAFNELVLTNNGLTLYNKVQTGTPLVFTKIAIGDGSLGVGQELVNLTALIHWLKDITISSVEIIASGAVRVRGSLSNQDIVAGIYIREIGLYANDPTEGEILYAVANAGTLADYMPAPGTDVVEETFDLVTIIGSSTNVSAVINESLVYATKADITKVINEGRGMALDLTYYRKRNIKLIANCEAGESGWANNAWAGNAGTYAADIVNFKTGNAGAKLDGGTVQNSGIHRVINLDLTQYEDGGASSDFYDYICLVLFIDATSRGRIGNLELAFCYDNYGTYTNYKYYRFSTSGLGDVNFLKIRKDSFLSEGLGSSTWSGIKGIDLHCYGSPSGAVSYTLDAIFMCRKDPLVNTKPNPFQKLVNDAWTRDIDIGAATDFWFVGEENSEIVCRNLNPTSSGITAVASSLKGAVAFYDKWIISAEIAIKTNFESCRVGWEIDNNDRIMAIVTANNLILYTTIAGTNDLTTTTSLSLKANDNLKFKLIRNGSSIQLYAIKNDDLSTQVLLSKETEYPAWTAGYLALGSSASCYCNVKSLAITATERVLSSFEADFAKNLISKWLDWIPALTWSGGTPPTATAEGKYIVIGKLVFFTLEISTSDGNDCTGLEISLPVQSVKAFSYTLFGRQKVGSGEIANPYPYVRTISLSSYYITFSDFQIATNSQTCDIQVSGFYETY